MIQRVAAVLVCTLAFALWAPTKAYAQDAFSCIEELSDDEVLYRIRYIEDKLEDGKKHATSWRYTWMSLWLAGGAGMTYAAVKNGRDGDQADKFGWAYLAAGSYFIATTHMFLPAADVWGAKRIRRMDDGSAEALRAKLLYATNTLKKASGVQSMSAGALGVVGGLVFGVVGGTVKATQWTGQSRGLTAGMYIGPPLLLGLQTATAPTEAMKAYEAYRGIACSSKYYDTHEAGPEFDFSVNPGSTTFRVRF
jgi:hypothetical protein